MLKAEPRFVCFLSTEVLHMQLRYLLRSVDESQAGDSDYKSHRWLRYKANWQYAPKTLKPRKHKAGGQSLNYSAVEKIKSALDKTFNLYFSFFSFLPLTINLELSSLQRARLRQPINSQRSLTHPLFPTNSLPNALMMQTAESGETRAGETGAVQTNPKPSAAGGYGSVANYSHLSPPSTPTVDAAAVSHGMDTNGFLSARTYGLCARTGCKGQEWTWALCTWGMWDYLTFSPWSPFKPLFPCLWMEESNTTINTHQKLGEEGGRSAQISTIETLFIYYPIYVAY